MKHSWPPARSDARRATSSSPTIRGSLRHLNDVTICSPIFRGKECIAFFASTCHTADIGGHVALGRGAEVYEKACRFHHEVYDAGRPNEALMAIIPRQHAPCRHGAGRLHAQIAGGAVGGERLLSS